MAKPTAAERAGWINSALEGRLIDEADLPTNSSVVLIDLALLCAPTDQGAVKDMLDKVAANGVVFSRKLTDFAERVRLSKAFFSTQVPFRQINLAASTGHLLLRLVEDLGRDPEAAVVVTSDPLTAAASVRAGIRTFQVQFPVIPKYITRGDAPTLQASAEVLRETDLLTVVRRPSCLRL